jgi:hypothetical protein
MFFVRCKAPAENMNRIIGFLCLLLTLIWAASLQAQVADSVDGVAIKDGQPYAMQGDRLEPLTQNLEFPRDIEVTTNGSFKVAKGKERNLLEGQVIQHDGWLLNPDGSIEPVFDHVTMQGKVFMVRDGESQALTNQMTFPNGLNVNPDGTCLYPDGSNTRLMDGQLFQLDGTPIVSKDTISMKNGHVVVQKEGKMISIMPWQTTGMNDGTTVRGDGLIQKKDGTQSHLVEGQTILVDGALVKH